MLAEHPFVGAGNPIQDFRSIQAADARALAIKMYGSQISSGGVPHNAYPPFTVRNAAAHIGMYDPDQTKVAVRNMASLASEVLGIINVSPQSFWGDDHWSFVSVMLKEHADELKAEYTAKVFAAKQLYRTRFETLNTPESAALLKVLEGLAKPEPEHGQQIIDWLCPACENDGWLTCDIERGPIVREMSTPHDWDETVAVTATPLAFDCPACNLSLEDEELDLAEDVPSSIELDDESPTQEDYEEEHSVFNDGW